MFEPRKPDVIVCTVCGEPVALKSATTDEVGHLVHSECYLRQLVARWAAQNSPLNDA
jgi:hypothetical protein